MNNIHINKFADKLNIYDGDDINLMTEHFIINNKIDNKKELYIIITDLYNNLEKLDKIYITALSSRFHYNKKNYLITVWRGAYYI